MADFRQLHQFQPDQLLYNEEETIVILKFIFEPADHTLIDSLPISDYLRGFSQSLLVEAIDASYSVGYVEGTFRSAANPTKAAFAVIKTFARKSSIHWFKHASVHDLQNIKVYDFVRKYIAQKFRHQLRDFIASTKLNERLGAFLAYKAPSDGNVVLWT